MPSTTLADIALAAGAAPVRAPAGAVLFRPEEACKGFIALSAGVIRVGLTSAGGREIVLYRVGPGEICLQTFSCLVEGRTYAAEGVAEEAVEGCLLSPEAFDALLGDSAPFRRAVLASVAERFGDYEQIVEALAFTGLQTRVAAALLRLAAPDGAARVTHEALATEIGSAREAVSRQLGLFARAGLVSLSRGRIDLMQPGALRRLAETSA